MEVMESGIENAEIFQILTCYSGRFPSTKNFRKFWWKFPSGEKRVPFNSGPFAAQ